MRVLLLKGQGQYGALRLHIDQAALGFNELGIETEILDLADPKNMDFSQYIGKEISLIFSVNIGADLRVGEYSLAQIVNAPHCIMYVDHPSDQLGRIKSTTSDQINAFLDTGHARWFNTVFQGQAGAVCVIPPGANFKSKVADDETTEEYLARRDIPILFTGTVRTQNEPSWRQELDSEGRQVLDAAYELCLSSNALPLDQALRIATSSLFGGVDPSIISQLFPLASYLHNQIHSVRRYQALCALADADIPVWVYGKGWEQHLPRLKSFQFKGEGSFEETLELLKRTRIVLNTNTNFVEGGHERVFAAQAAGAAVISDHSSWLDQRYSDNKNIAFFNWQPELNIAECILALINNPELTFNIAINGKQETLTNHTWKKRMQDVLNIAQQTAAWRN